MKKVNLEVTVKEAELILASLQELPFKLSSELIINLSNQANEQLKEIPQMEGTMEALDEL